MDRRGFALADERPGALAHGDLQIAEHGAGERLQMIRFVRGRKRARQSKMPAALFERAEHVPLEEKLRQFQRHRIFGEAFFVERGDLVGDFAVFEDRFDAAALLCGAGTCTRAVGVGNAVVPKDFTKERFVRRKQRR